MTVVVSNSSPLIFLARVGQLDILKALFGKIVVSPEVFDEVVTQGSGKPGSAEVAEAGQWIQVQSVDPHVLGSWGKRIRRIGDASVVALAKEMSASLAIVDDRELRRIIQNEGLVVVGTGGVLVMAKRRGLIGNVKEILDKMLAVGLRISQQLYDEVLEEAGE